MPQMFNQSEQSKAIKRINERMKQLGKMQSAENPYLSPYSRAIRETGVEFTKRNGQYVIRNTQENQKRVEQLEKKLSKYHAKTASEIKRETKKELKKEQKTEQKIERRIEKKEYYKKSDNPDVLYGREFDGEYTKIEDITEESGEVIIHGQIIFRDTREIRNERTILTFDITDFTDTISAKMFVYIMAPIFLDICVFQR